jgi:hypothetical protein
VSRHAHGVLLVPVLAYFSENFLRRLSVQALGFSVQTSLESTPFATDMMLIPRSPIHIIITYSK